MADAVQARRFVVRRCENRKYIKWRYAMWENIRFWDDEKKFYTFHQKNGAFSVERKGNTIFEGKLLKLKEVEEYPVRPYLTHGTRKRNRAVSPGQRREQIYSRSRGVEGCFQRFKGVFVEEDQDGHS